MITLIALLSFTLVFSCQKEESANVPADQAIEGRSPNPNSRIFPPNAHPYGKPVSEWSADWWAHMFSFDCDNLPISDADGSNAGLNLDSPVLFLAGNFGGASTRSITVPHGKALLFPILNNLWAYSPCYGAAEEDEAFANGTLEAYILSQTDPVLTGPDIILSAALDGVAFNNLRDYRYNSGLYSFDPNPGLAGCFGDPCLNEDGLLWLSNGYWIMLKPLQYGEHTLNFKGGIPEFGFSLDVTYHITVE